MFAMLIPIISSLLGANGPIGQYFKSKNDQLIAEQEYRMEILRAQTEQAKAEVQQVSDRLDSTSQEFKQMTFWFICVPMILTVCPWTSAFAVTMWTNFKLIPEWFQILFASVYCSIWGLPIAKEYLGGMFRSLGGAIEARREFKLEKARINREAVFASIRKSLGGIDQKTVDMIDGALNEGEK